VAPHASPDLEFPSLSHEFELPPITFQSAEEPLEPMGLDFDRSLNAPLEEFGFWEPIDLFSGMF
jgi:hypothetical protein